MDAVMDRDPAPAVTFSSQLRSATQVEHRRTEQSPFIRRLLTGQAPLTAFAAMTGQWQALYAALEQAIRTSASDPTVAVFADPLLERRATIEADLAHLLGADWQAATAPSNATQAYIDRLTELAATEPGWLVAHHYLRYLGDLSGGQVIARLAARTYALAGAGLTFYEFADIADKEAYKAAYRRRLDALPFDQPSRDRFVAEVDRGYRMTAAIFADLERDVAAPDA